MVRRCGATLAMLVVVGCGAPGTTPSNDTDTGVTTPTGDTRTEDTGTTALRLSRGFVTGAWAVDPDTGALHSATLPDKTVIRPHLRIRWGIDTWNGDLDLVAEYCTITAWLDGVTLETYPPRPHPYGIVVPDTASVESDCAGSGLDLSSFPAGDPAAGSLPPAILWTVGFGGPLGPGLAVLLDPDELVDLDQFIGGTVLSPAIRYGGSPNVYLRAFAIDDAQNVQTTKAGDWQVVGPLALRDPYTYALTPVFLELTVPFLIDVPQ